MKTMSKISAIITRIICTFLFLIGSILSITGFFITENVSKWVCLALFIFFLFFITFVWIKTRVSNRYRTTNKNKSVSKTPYSTITTEDIPDEFPKETVPIYVETDDTIVRTDGKPITDKGIPHLIEVGYTKAIEYKKNSPNPKFHRSEYEEELSFRFIEKYSSQVAQLEQAFEIAYRNSYNSTNIDEKIQQLENTIQLYEKAKQFCYSKGKGGTIYFDDMWEHLHNSQHPDYSYITNVYEELENVKDIKMVAVPQILKFAEDGFLQKDIYDKLDCDFSKNEIRKIIDSLVLENLITKEKRGNSYFIKSK